jgi:hypothetical protein
MIDSNRVGRGLHAVLGLAGLAGVVSSVAFGPYLILVAMFVAIALTGGFGAVEQYQRQRGAFRVGAVVAAFEILLTVGSSEEATRLTVAILAVAVTFAYFGWFSRIESGPKPS